ncbi:hypothetical protein NIES4103_05800 [Nostoc sp. NIES-4103]|nr:hypothetical protein NIES4103_05800 [Nostoc sp. NIES-4103]
MGGCLTVVSLRWGDEGDEGDEGDAIAAALALN